jgi:hypothetical protein
MTRRLPILPLAFAATVGLFAFTSWLTAQQPASTDSKPGEIKRTQEENKKRYNRLTTDILKLALRWEKSDNAEDQARAKILRAVLKLADEKGIDTLFKELVQGIDNKNTNTGDVGRLINSDDKLIAALEEILKTLDTEDEQSAIRRDINNLKELIKEVERLKREQENLRARTENPRTDADKLAKDQDKLAKQTQELADRVAGKDPAKKGDAANAKDDKSQAKPENKPGEAAPEAKPDTQESKSSDKGGDPKSGEPKAGEPKNGDPKNGDPKNGDPKNGDPKNGDPKGNMEPGSSKESPKDGPMAGEAKGGEPKPMGGSPMDPKGGDQKPTPAEGKAQGDGKGDMKPSDGQKGADNKPMSGQQSSPNSSPPSSSKPSGSPSGDQQSSNQQQNGNQQQRPNDQAQENIQQAVPHQQGAEQDLKKQERSDASKKEDEAIKSLEKAIQELEKRLKQLREKELAKLLGNLEERVARMLRMQQEVYEATKAIDRTVRKNNNQKTTSEHQKSQIEADKEGVIVGEAEKALKLMEAESSAVVFAGVLSQVKGDMEAVKKRLEDGRVEGRNKADQAEGTQLIEEDIIEQLTMMKEALKKAKKDLENQQNKPPMQGNSGGEQEKRLLEMINELKLIKSLQEQVNKRTNSYSKQDPGEQAKDPLIQAELKQLSDRQRVLQEMLHKIATEANQ